MSGFLSLLSISVSSITSSVDSGIVSKADTSRSVAPSLTCLAAPMKEEGASLVAAGGEDCLSVLILFLATVLRR